jgi:hypothetical protein
VVDDPGLMIELLIIDFDIVAAKVFVLCRRMDEENTLEVCRFNLEFGHFGFS